VSFRRTSPWGAGGRSSTAAWPVPRACHRTRSALDFGDSGAQRLNAAVSCAEKYRILPKSRIPVTRVLDTGLTGRRSEISRCSARGAVLTIQKGLRSVVLASLVASMSWARIHASPLRWHGVSICATPCPGLSVTKSFPESNACRTPVSKSQSRRRSPERCAVGLWPAGRAVIQRPECPAPLYSFADGEFNLNPSPDLLPRHVTSTADRRARLRAAVHLVSNSLT